jgi:hypothetical protein
VTEESKKDEVKIDEFELMCGQCTGDLVEVPVKRQTPKLFTPVYFTKWFYHCNFCGKQTKIYCNRK